MMHSEGFLEEAGLEMSVFCPYIEDMGNRKGRPPSDKTKQDYLEVRLDADEKQAFKDAADLSGLALSAWVRERLRLVARKELDEAGKQVAFLK
jgi:hypothetical protein